MVSRPPTPVQLANDSTTEAIAGSQTQARTMIVGMATIRIRKIRSVPVTRTRPPARRGAALAGVAGTVGRSVMGASLIHWEARLEPPGLPRAQEVKIDFFWLSRLLVSPSMSLGFLRKVCS